MCRLIKALGKVRRGKLQEKNLNKNTFEAGMCMETNKSMTKWLEKVGHFCLSFGHFRLTNTNSAEFWGEFTVAYNNPHERNSHTGRVVWGVVSESPKGESGV
jgi:hypothetical protein